MAYRTATIQMTLSDVQSHSSTVSLLRVIYDLSYSCTAFDKILTDISREWTFSLTDFIIGVYNASLLAVSSRINDTEHVLRGVRSSFQLYHLRVTELDSQFHFRLRFRPKLELEFRSEVRLRPKTSVVLVTFSATVETDNIGFGWSLV